MVHALSGHLVIQCDGYEELASGSQDEEMTFVTDHTTPEPPTPDEMSRGSSDLKAENALIAKTDTAPVAEPNDKPIGHRRKRRDKK